MRKLLTQTKWSPGILLLAILFSGCEGQEDTVVKDRNLEISNDVEELSKRITPKNETLDVVSQDGNRVARDFELTLVGKLASPEIDGKKLQATSLYYHKGNYLVSYNFQGDEYLGGVDFVSSDLKVLSEILLRDADIHAVTGHDKYAYLCGAKADEESPAYVERFLLEDSKFSKTENGYKSLGSYAATSVIENQGKIVVTTGNDEQNGGGVYRLDKDLNTMEYFPAHDARWLSSNGNDLYVGQGSPGVVSRISADELEFEVSYSFDGANEPEAKTTVEVADDRIFLAAGKNGVIVLNKEDGTLLHTLTFEGENCVTNAVSAENGLLFISNGEGGAYVASYSPSKVSEAPEVLGKIALEGSVNHILYRRSKLWVASGMGGVKMVDLDD